MAVASIEVSALTLKRIFGKYADKDYNPQAQTKDALAIYFGYKNWSDFKQQVDVLHGQKKYSKCETKMSFFKFFL